MKKKLLSLLLIGIFVFGCVGCTEEKEKNNSNGGGTEKTAVKKKTLGDKIEFDGLELTFASDYTFTTLDNEFSDKNGSTVIKIGVNVKNISSEKNSLNMFFYDLFGSKGTELDSVTAYFDDTIDFAGDLKPGAYSEDENWTYKTQIKTGGLTYSLFSCYGMPVFDIQ